jgi:hypothetical protein
MLVAQRGIRRTCDRKKILKQTHRYSYLIGFIQFIYLVGAATPGSRQNILVVLHSIYGMRFIFCATISSNRPKRHVQKTTRAQRFTLHV